MPSFTSILVALVALNNIHAVQGRVSNTTTSTTNAISASSPASHNTCGTTFDPCPACDGQTFKDAGGVYYTASCDNFIASTSQYGIPSVNTTRQCLEACDELSGCLGIYFVPSLCTLITGTIVGVEPQPGYNAYVRPVIGTAISRNASTATSTSKASTKAASSVSTSYFQPTEVAPPPFSNTSTTSQGANCPSTNITCPACDGEQVLSESGIAYKVYCDNQVYAESDYNVQRYTSPEGCLAECDSFDWCQGSTFHPEANCQLAKGEDVFPQEKLGYIAFLPVPNRTAVAAVPKLSAYPTLNGYSAVPTKPASTLATIATSAPASSSTPSCHPDMARCPACEGKNVTDWLNQTYTISCHEIPICGLVVNRANHTLQFECLEYCDADPVCFAAMWESGRCSLCQETLEGKALQVQAGPSDFVYYYPEAPSVVTSRAATSSLSTRTTRTVGTGSIVPITTQSGITSTVTSLAQALLSTAASLRSSVSTSQIQHQTFITAPSPSKSATMVWITGTVTQLSPVASSVTRVTSSASFVPPLTDGSVSFATPGGQTRV
ncbi:hypothetical protein LTR56_010188 [Elasticomyces elasticus]|nr:hypothetical protein LTR22_017262 [Elasticomyces elasticus]KAK3643450.1 hypothetical protein LTR56_010188 [Elasticomyces elasticus]KAK4925342.1 hypothetical protein LTR49_007640 [Elasticomyces elasticus]KAK5761287.1 hypothetical protein LTS12_008563 [Elasticomyces elasticus]